MRSVHHLSFPFFFSPSLSSILFRSLSPYSAVQSPHNPLFSYVSITPPSFKLPRTAPKPLSLTLSISPGLSLALSLGCILTGSPLFCSLLLSPRHSSSISCVLSLFPCATPSPILYSPSLSFASVFFPFFQSPFILSLPYRF